MGGVTTSLCMAAVLPVGDWQFWVASVIALAALWIVINSVVPSSLLPWKSKTKSTKASLTISAKRADERATPASKQDRTDH